VGPIRVKVDGHLLIPFGVEKWRIEDVKVSGVSTEATYFESSAPLCHIDMSKGDALRLYQADTVLSADWPPYVDDIDEGLRIINRTIQNECQFDASSEVRFLDLYFAYILSRVKPTRDYLRDKIPASEPRWGYEALLPLPQAHLYLRDPLAKRFSFSPDRMFKVDFAFWTGSRLVAVEIDGKTHIGSPQHIVKDRLMQRANVHVIHIMNEELVSHGLSAISQLLPPEIVAWWKHPDKSDRSAPSYGPFDPF
jgi:hypothetical protein